jgi:hypothetical protein
MKVKFWNDRRVSVSVFEVADMASDMGTAAD